MGKEDIVDPVQECHLATVRQRLFQFMNLPADRICRNMGIPRSI